MGIQTSILIPVSVGQHSVLAVDGKLLIRIDCHQNNPYLKEKKKQIHKVKNIVKFFLNVTAIRIDSIIVHKPNFQRMQDGRFM